jgi:hypothetical protein
MGCPYTFLLAQELSIKSSQNIYNFIVKQVVQQFCRESRRTNFPGYGRYQKQICLDIYNSPAANPTKLKDFLFPVNLKFQGVFLFYFLFLQLRTL